MDPGDYQHPGVAQFLPAFYPAVLDRMNFPLAWQSGRYGDFDQWRQAARAKVMECLLKPPPAAPFEPRWIAQEDRGSYVACKLTLNITGDSRVLAYLLVPKSPPPHPAVVLLHDHGARFDIGKEKVIRPFGDAPKLESATPFVKLCYGGLWIGDELARRGYVCFATDALNWSDRGGAGFDGQNALASNLMHMGMSWAGLIAHEDLRATEFVSQLGQVDARRVAAMGLSMGGYRAWQLSALTDRIAAGVAICWMGTIAGQMQPGMNQTAGQSAFSMLHPGLHDSLDYPDVASIACPKPMLFFNGAQDPLFPADDVRRAYDRMRQVWASQGASEHLVTKLFDAPHEFNQAMQQEAFAWLDMVLSHQPPASYQYGAAPELAP
jgi:dienelactone hydrolase